MAQERYHNYNRPVASLPENFRLAGVIPAGVYAGFDTFAIVGGSQLKMTHASTGLKRLKADSTGDEGPFGVFSTRQGVLIYDDEEVQVTVDLAVTNPRIDILVVNHTFLDSPGGSPATYAVIKGAENAIPVRPPVALPLSQIILGHFIVYPGADHTNTIFVRSDVKKLGGQYAFSKATEEELALAAEKDFNKIQRTGVYFMDNVTTSRPSTSTAYWALWVMKRGDRLVQFAFANDSGRAYVRAATTFVTGVATAWGAWINLNNPDVPAADLTPVFAAIGTRLYTQDNYVTDSQSLTASVDALDIALKALDLILDQAVIDIDNAESAIGNRSYTQDNIVTDGENLTTSIDKLDQSWGKYAGATNFNSLTQSGVYAITSSTATNAPGPAIFNLVGHLTVAKYDASNIRQLFRHDLTGQEWTRTRVSGTWGAWFISKLAIQVTSFSAWNMDTTPTKVIPLTGSIGSKIVTVKATVYDDTLGPLFNKYTLEHSVAGVKQWWVNNISSNTQIVLQRLTSGTFDAPAFNAAGGEVVIEYGDF